MSGNGLANSPMSDRLLCRQKVLVLGATGTIGRATVRSLVENGHDVVCLVRQRAGVGGALAPAQISQLLAGVTLRFGDATAPTAFDPAWLARERFDALVSCLASRTGLPADAWAIDHAAHVRALDAAKAAGIKQMVLLSAICLQKPRLAFQHAKLAFERALIESGLTYSIVRPTAFFKSLSGQVERVRKGAPFVVFDDGTLTSCKPIADDDLGRYIADCLIDRGKHDRILPIGGPGEAITPRQQGEKLFELLGKKPRFQHMPLAMLDTIIGALGIGGRVIPTLARKAELARIGRYYATESMLVLNPQTGLYDADATPATGSQTLFDYYARLIDGTAKVERGDHAVF